MKIKEWTPEFEEEVIDYYCDWLINDCDNQYAEVGYLVKSLLAQRIEFNEDLFRKELYNIWKQKNMNY